MVGEGRVSSEARADRANNEGEGVSDGGSGKGMDGWVCVGEDVWLVVIGILQITSG
jgi:hypothetical protein